MRGNGAFDDRGGESAQPVSLCLVIEILMTPTPSLYLCLSPDVKAGIIQFSTASSDLRFNILAPDFFPLILLTSSSNSL